MHDTAAAVAGAVTFMWLGMVVAISFLEAPLKFRAPGVTIPIGLGIGRLVFRALNTAEALLALGILGAVALGDPPAEVIVIFVALILLLAIQLGVIRPRLNRRSDRVLAAPPDEELPRSRAHLAYIGSESAKLALLIALGILIYAA